MPACWLPGWKGYRQIRSGLTEPVGVRGSLLRMLEFASQSPTLDEKSQAQLEQLLRLGFWMLENAAREIPEPAKV